MRLGRRPPANTHLSASRRSFRKFGLAARRPKKSTSVVIGSRFLFLGLGSAPCPRSARWARSPHSHGIGTGGSTVADSRRRLQLALGPGVEDAVVGQNLEMSEGCLARSDCGLRPPGQREHGASSDPAARGRGRPRVPRARRASSRFPWCRRVSRTPSGRDACPDRSGKGRICRPWARLVPSFRSVSDRNLVQCLQASVESGISC